MNPLSNRRIARSAGYFALLLAVVSPLWAQPPLTVTYTKPGVDIGQYAAIKLLPLSVSDARVVPPPWVENADPHEWSLTGEHREFLVTTFARAVRDGITGDGKYAVVEDARPGTLQLEVRLISLTPWASRRERDATTLGSGTLTFEAYVRDARTADLLVAFQGTQQVGKDFQENTPGNKELGLAEHFSTWGTNISRRLAAAQAR